MNEAILRWSEDLVRERLAIANKALAKARRKPGSAKRLHRARKALARLRAILDDTSSVFAPANDPLQDLRQLYRRAGRVRDADVLLDRVEHYREEVGVELSELCALRAALCKRRRKASRAFKGTQKQSSIDPFGFAAFPHSSGSSTRKRLQTVFLDGIAQPHDAGWEIVRVRLAEALAAQGALGGMDDNAIHAFRLACKRLRYAIEALDARTSTTKQAGEVLERITDELGAAHDCVLLAELAQVAGACLTRRRSLAERDAHVIEAAQKWRDAFKPGNALELLALEAGWSRPLFHGQVCTGAHS